MATSAQLLAVFRELERRIGEIEIRQGGPAGPRGATGPKGRKGEKGARGPKGEVGLQGKTGPAGEKGAPGPTGAPGPKGMDGLSGRDGRDGTDGRDGADGQPGVSVQDAQIDSVDGRLSLYLSDGSVIDAGQIIGDEVAQQIVYNAGGGVPQSLKDDLDKVIEDLNNHIGSTDGHPVFTETENGFVPAPGTSTLKFLRDDGTWAEASVISYTEVVTDFNPGADEIWTDVNQMDFSASPYASGTSLDVKANHTVSFITDGNSILYKYIGPKPVLLGQGGNYATSSADFIAEGNADHNALSNLQGGLVGQYFHLTAAEHTDVIDWVANGYDYGDLINVPTEFNPAPHTHVEADITDLDKYTQAEVDAKDAQVLIDANAYTDAEIVTHTADANAHHNQIHLLYGPYHSDVNTATPLAERHMLGWQGGEWVPNYRVEAVTYVQGNTYYPQQMVFQDGYLMVANKETTEYPAPVTVGDAITSLPDVPIWDVNGSDLATVYSGHLYTFNRAGYYRGLRVWVPTVTATTNYRFVIVANPNSANPSYSVIEEPVLNENSWTTLDVDTILVGAGSELLVYIDALDSGASISPGGTPADWFYTGTDNSIPPSPGDWNTNVQNSLLRVHQQTADAVIIDFNGTVPGTTFTMTSNTDANRFVRYITQSAESFDGAVYSWTVVVDAIGANGAPQLNDRTIMEIDVPVAAVTEWKQDPTYWATGEPVWGTVTGYLQLDGVTQPGAEDTAFGVDIAFQELQVPVDWDVYGIPGGGAGGGGGEGGLEPHVLNYHDDVTIVTPADREVLTYNNATGQWENITPAVSPIGGIDLGADWSDDLTATDPGAGNIKINNADSTLATELYASGTTSFGNDANFIWQALEEGEYLGIWETASDNESIYYLVNGPVVDNGGWYTVPVVWVAGVGTPENNRNVNVFFINDPLNKLPAGGDAGQVLTKQTSANYDTEWTTPFTQTDADALYADKTTTEAHIADTDIHFSDAPADGNQYARKDNAWEQVVASGGGATEVEITQAGHGFAELDCIRWDGAAWVKAQADDINTTALGVVIEVVDANTFKYAITGRYSISTLLTPEEWYFLSADTAGGLTADSPVISQPIVYVEDANTVSIYAYRPSYESGSLEPESKAMPLVQLQWAGNTPLTTSLQLMPGDILAAAQNIDGHFDYDLGAGTITCLRDGLVRMGYGVTIIGNPESDARSTAKMMMVRDGVSQVGRTIGYTYHRTIDNSEMSMSKDHILNVTAGQVVQLGVQQESGTMALEVVGGNSWFRCEYLDTEFVRGPAGPTGPGGATGVHNFLINGHMEVWQRGSVFATTGNGITYSADRWVKTGTEKHQRVDDAPLDGVNNWSLQSYDTTQDFMTIRQGVELLNTGDTYPFRAGGTYTFSGWVKATAGRTINLRLAWVDAVGSVPGRVIDSEFTMTTSDGDWQRVEQTVTLSTVPAVTNVALEVLVSIGNSEALPGDILQLHGAQFEAGSSASAFAIEHVAETWDKCQRYYQAYKADAFERAVWTVGDSNSERAIVIHFRKVMNGAPTVTRNAFIDEVSITQELVDPRRWYCFHTVTGAGSWGGINGTIDFDAEL